MTEVTKIFRHLARDLFIYFLPGFIVILNLGYVDFCLNETHVLNYLKTLPQWVFCVLIVSFIVGHFVFTLMYLFFDYSGFDNRLKKNLFPLSNSMMVFKVDEQKEIEIYKKALDLHEQFIERHTQLYLMRWNLSGGLLLSGIINLIFGICFHFTLPYTLITIIFILAAPLFYILSLKTEKDCADRIDNIHTLV